MRTPVPEEVLLRISNSLEDYHKCFYVFWEMSEVYFTDELPTAAIKFNKGAKPTLLLNKEFWDRHNHLEQLFIICHECMHVLLDHGIRNGMKTKGATPYLVNVAQDITINEMIVDLFKYRRDDLREWKKYCWIDTCFKDPAVRLNILRNQIFTYYLEKLIQNPPPAPPPPPEKGDGSPSEGDGEPGDGESSPQTLDQHVMDEDGDCGGGEEETEEEKKARAGAIEKIIAELDPAQIEEIIKALPDSGEAGSMKGSLKATIAKKQKLAKLNFKKLVAKLKRTCMTEKFRDVETFVKDDRRFGDVLRRPDVLLPGRMEQGYPDKDKLLTACFMDISGSCMAYFDHFQKIFMAFDAEKKTFETRLFAFDTSVVEVKAGETITVGGGTHFHIIEKQCLKLEQEVGRYPDCVVIITDGEGTTVTPKAPTKWVWLLTPFATKSYIPKASRSWPIKDVIFE